MVQRSLARRLAYSWLRMVCRVVAVTLYGIRCRGREHLPPRGPVLVCANHQSVLDPVLVGITFQRRLNFVARKSLFRFTPFRWLIEYLDAIPLDRSGLGIGGLKECLRRFSRGEMVLIFPEGTRTRDGSVGPFQPGVLTLARRGGVALLPVGIDGAFESWPRHARFPRLAPIRIRVGEPLTPDHIRQLDDRQLLAALEDRVRACHAAARRDRLCR